MSVNAPRLDNIHAGKRFSQLQYDVQIQSLVDLINNANAGLLSWDNIKLGSATNQWSYLNASSLIKSVALTASQPVRTDASGLPTTGASSLTADVTGVLPIANGGTNSSTALSNGRFMVSTGGTIVEAANPVVAPTPINMNSQKITNLTNGSAAQDAAAFSQLKVIQIGAIITSTTGFSTTSATFQTTNLSGSITPTSASNRVLILAMGQVSVGANNDNAFVSIFNGSTNLMSANGAGGPFNNGATSSEIVQTLIWIDSPASVAAQTYSVKLRNTGGAATVQFGRVGTQTMILAEIV